MRWFQFRNNCNRIGLLLYNSKVRVYDDEYFKPDRGPAVMDLLQDMKFSKKDDIDIIIRQ